MKRYGKFVSPIIFILASSVLAFAQFESQVQGVVRDTTGAVLPGAKVTLKNLDTGAIRETLTNESGFYWFTRIPPGNYELRAELSGFKTTVWSNIKLEVAEVKRVDLTLEVGELAETVNVTAEAPVVETEQGRVSGVLEEKQITELPLKGRNIYALLALQPGVLGKGLIGDIFNIEMPSVNASGQRIEANNFQLDSNQINDAPFGGPLVNPNVDSVREVRVVSNNVSAEYGRNSGALINAVSKSGTNELHGSLFYFHRNDNLTARNVFEASVPEFKRHQFGYSVGGPIWKNHTFFFHSYEGVRDPGAVRGFVATVETPQFRDFVIRTRPNSIAAFLFRNYPPKFDPTFNLQDIGSPAPGVFKKGEPDGIPDIGNVNMTLPSRRSGNQFNIRIDHEFNQARDRIYGNYYDTDWSVVFPHIRPAFDRKDPMGPRFLNVSFTHIFSPKVLNEFRFGYTRWAGKPGGEPFEPLPEIPEISIVGTTGFGQWGGFPSSWAQNNFEWKDVVSMIKGNHNLKLGVEFRRGQDNGALPFYVRPAYSFADIFDFADDEPFQELRGVDPRTGRVTHNVRGFRTFEYGAFIQDDWKVTPNLTLNLGLRYENYTNPSEVHGVLTNFFFGPGATFQERLASGRNDLAKQLYKSDNNNFGPRFGFAWDPTRKGKLALRGGFGISYNRGQNTGWTDNRFNPPVYAIVASGFFQGTPVLYTLGKRGEPNFGFPENPGLRVGLDERNGIRGSRVTLWGPIDQDFRLAYAYNWFLGWQYELMPRLVAEINWLGSAGHKLQVQENINRLPGDLLDGRLDRINPSFDWIVYTQSKGNSIYNGAAIQIRKAFSKGWMLQGAYTFGRSIDDRSGGRVTSVMDVTRGKLERGLSDFDATHKLALSGIWELPLFQSGSGTLRNILGGWQINAMVILQSGNPFTVFTSAPFPRGDFNADGDLFDRPNQPAFGNKLKDRSRSDYLRGVFSVSDFPVPELGTNGTLGRNTFRGPGYANVDFSAFKEFKAPWFTAEGATIQFRAEFFNFFNRVNLQNPVSDMASPVFGKSVGAFPSREIQFGLKLIF